VNLDPALVGVIQTFPPDVQRILTAHYGGLPHEQVLRLVTKRADAQRVCISSPGRELARIVLECEERYPANG
jgi:hypothetical protein